VFNIIEPIISPLLFSSDTKRCFYCHASSTVQVSVLFLFLISIFVEREHISVCDGVCPQAVLLDRSRVFAVLYLVMVRMFKS